MAEPKDNPGVIAWPPLVFAATITTGGLLHLVWPVRLLPTGPARVGGAVFALLAGTLASWAERMMKVADTNVRPDRPTTAIVTTGPYRFTRNPMYVALCLLHLGISLLIDGLLPLLFLIPLILVLHFGVIRREEKYLTAKFGAEYLALQHRVRRWL